MASTYWALTYNTLATQIKTRLRITATTTAQDTAIEQAINAAMLELWDECGQPGPAWRQVRDSVTTTSGTQYTDIDSDPKPASISVDSFYVNDADAFLTFYPNLHTLLKLDPAGDVGGEPTAFSIFADPDDADTLRIYWYPTPDATYTVYFTSVLLPVKAEADASLTDFPDRFHRIVADKATEYAARNLGMHKLGDYWEGVTARKLPAFKRVMNPALQGVRTVKVRHRGRRHDRFWDE